MKIALIISIVINIILFILWRIERNDNLNNKEELRLWRLAK